MTQEDKNRLESLLIDKLHGALTPEQEQELALLLEQVEEGPALEALLARLHTRLKGLKGDFSPDLERILPALKQGKCRRIKNDIRLIPWLFRAAAVVLLVGGYLIVNRLPDRVPPPENRCFSSVARPGSLHAILELYNGLSLNPDTLRADTVFTESGESVTAVSTEMILSLTGCEENSREGEMQRLVVPQGAEYRIILDDGTLVWLNSASVLEFPLVFGEGPRQIRLYGEAYLQVRKDAERPFLVEAGEVTVRVTGTTLNIKAYPEEESVKTTLITGAVDVFGAGGEPVRLRPGEQAVAAPDGIEVQPVDVDPVISWVNGRFVFINTPLQEIAVQIARWYDVEISFADPALKEVCFSGSIQRFRPLKELIQRIESTSHARFSISGDTIIISEM